METPRAADIVALPHQTSEKPYLNFLTYFKRQHRRYGPARLLKEGRQEWASLTYPKQCLFEKKRILARTARLPQEEYERLVEESQQEEAIAAARRIMAMLENS